jgi:hypothetical protein
LTHLKRVLLFKDSRGPGRMDSMSFSRNWCGIGPYQGYASQDGLAWRGVAYNSRGW